MFLKISFQIETTLIISGHFEIAIKSFRHVHQLYVIFVFFYNVIT